MPLTRPPHRESEVRKSACISALCSRTSNLSAYTALQNITLAGELLAKEKPEYKANRKAIHAELEEKARTLLAQMGLSERENHYRTSFPAASNSVWLLPRPGAGTRISFALMNQPAPLTRS